MFEDTYLASGDFVDALEDEYYHVGKYGDQYTKWLQLHQGWDQTISYYINTFHTLYTKLGN
jgi:hypothetical protein